MQHYSVLLVWLHNSWNGIQVAGEGKQYTDTEREFTGGMDKTVDIIMCKYMCILYVFHMHNSALILYDFCVCL